MAGRVAKLEGSVLEPPSYFFHVVVKKNLHCDFDKALFHRHISEQSPAFGVQVDDHDVKKL